METWSRTTPWRQGKFLSKETAVQLGLFLAEDDDLLVVVISHDCDLSQSEKAEPRVEVIVGKKITKDEFNGNYANAKNARKLHLLIQGGDKPYIELEALKKKSIRKALLIRYRPTDITLRKSDKTILQRWLASRYRRSAFPDEFEQRLTVNKLDQKIADAGKKLGRDIAAIYFDIADDKIGSGEVYVLDIIILYQTDESAEDAKKSAEFMKDKIEKAFQAKLFNASDESWREIELRYVDVISDEALTYRQSQMLRAWRLEHISLGAEPQQSISHD